MNHQVADHAWALQREFMVNRMEELRISVYQLSKLTGIHQANLGRYLSGKTTPSVINYFRILQALQINPHLVTREGDDMPYPKISGPDPR